MTREVDAWKEEALAARLKKAQGECPYFKKQEPVEGLQDDKMCLYDMQPCEGRASCPLGKWSWR